MLKSFSYVRPTSLDEAVTQLKAGGARVHAGGTDLIGCLQNGVFDAERVVSLAAIPALRGIRDGSGGAMRIGALTPLSEIAGHPLVHERYPALAQAASVVGTPQLRNQGTLGGNLCQKPRCPYYRGPFACRRKGGDICFAMGGPNEGHAIFGGVRCHMVHPSDTAAALTALGATVVVAGPDGERRVAMDDFFVPPRVDPTRETVLQPGELVSEVLLPRPAEGVRSSYRKAAQRQTWDFALAGVALALRFADGRVAEANVVFSGVAPVPWRSAAAEEALAGHPLTPEVVERAAAAAVEGASPMRDNAYKVELLRGVLEQSLSALS